MSVAGSKTVQGTCQHCLAGKHFRCRGCACDQCAKRRAYMPCKPKATRKARAKKETPVPRPVAPPVGPPGWNADELALLWVEYQAALEAMAVFFNTTRADIEAQLVNMRAAFGLPPV